MASGLVGADGDRDLTEDLHPKNEVCIVYTRKNRRKAPGNSNSEAAEKSVGVESARAEPTPATSPARSRLSNDEVVPRPVLEGVQVGQDGNFTEEADSKNECLTHDGSRGPEESRDGNEALTDRGAEPRLLGEVEVREEPQVSACEIVQSVLQPTVGEEPFLDRGPEFLSDSGKEIDANNQKVANGGCQSVGNGREDQVSDSRTESFNNGKELQPISGQSDQGDELNDTGDDSVLPNGREEPQLSYRQATMAIGGVGRPNGVAPVISRNGMLKPVICRVTDRVRVALSETNSKVELRGLKRKFENELDQVRNVAKRLEAKQLQIDSFNSGSTISRSTYISNSAGNLGFYNQPQLIRVNSVVGSGGHPETRPFRHLNVSVMENSHGAGEFAEKEKRTPKANKFYRNSEFLLGNDRLSQESNKMLKANGAGKKHGIAVENGFGFGFGADKNIDKVFKSCSNLLQRLMKHKHGWVFNSPVDAEKLDLPDYHDIIKQPMDFGTIKDRLTQNLYRSTRQFAEDVRLVFRNAMTYNPKGQDVHSMAEELSEIFEDKWTSIEKEYFPYHVYYDAGLPTPNPPRRTHPLPPPMPAPLSIPTPSRSAPPMRTLDRSESVTMPSSTRRRPGNMDTPHTGRTLVPKKPKAKDPHKRDMTYEEKQKLSTNLQSLPSEKLDAVVQIINRRNSGLSQHNDEIEVDIDSVDAETLWELDRFVTNYRKSLSKYKRKTELAEQARVAAAKSVLATNPAPPASLDSQTEGPPGGNINPAPVQVGIQGDNASPSSSSSSSSSSDSGSSSSDSDSDSSSAGSDAGHSPRTSK